MTDKQIIIDGVDIKDCKRRIGKDNFCRYYKRPCAENNYNCIWKKYLRKEQECEELKKQLERKEENYQKLLSKSNKYIHNLVDENVQDISNLGRQLDQLKAENEILKEKLVISSNSDKKTLKIIQTLTEIKEIAEPYKMTINKICGNCKKYDDCHACCYKDINCYKYTSPKTNACEEFTYLDKFVPNILANSILQKISECEVENA